MSIFKASILLTLLFTLTACERGPKLTNTCEFAMQDQLPNAPSVEATELFELAKAHDGAIYRTNQRPEPAPPVLEKYQHIEKDRVKSRGLYEQAAKLGHVDAMYRLATFQAEGIGLPNDDFTPDFDAAFYWFKEGARRGDPYGFNALANFYLYGIERKVNEPLGEQCLIQAAARGLMLSQIRLAKLDLRKLAGYERERVNPPHKLERGLRLLEDAGLKGNNSAIRIMGSYYDHKNISAIKAEYYYREGIKQGNSRSRTALEGSYRVGDFGSENQHLHTCVDALKPEDFPHLEELCPRVGGPLTRERVGLPPAPTEPLDVRAYLEEFERKHGTPE